MPTLTIRGVPVTFPFEPYELQKDYMEKVIECLQTGSNGVLESPTGTGKTLSLLCSSLAWLSMKKAEIQSYAHVPALESQDDFMRSLNEQLKAASQVPSQEGAGRSFMQCPTIIYSSRTHSQLSQAMQELKTTAYSGMRAVVLGSRDQLCVHPEVENQESSSAKIFLCQAKVKSRSCLYYSRTEKKSEDPAILGNPVMDIEDLGKLGRLHRFCPFYMAKQLKNSADIVFLPYNYLLQPRTWRALGIDISNSYVIIDEAHNVEKSCEDSASLTLKSTDIALCIEEVTCVMAGLADGADFSDTPKDISPDELMKLKEIFLNFEKLMEKVEIGPDSKTYDGDFLLEMLEKVGITSNTYHLIIHWLDKSIQYLTLAQQTALTMRKGDGLELFSDLLVIAFMGNTPEFREKIKKCYKVHFMYEEPKKKKTGSVWIDNTTSNKRCRIMNYWCFSPGFGMGMLIKKGVRSIILTSGTLAPLLPLISELDLDVKVTLENPHIVKVNQVLVRVLTKGPDGEVLNCSYQNRDNPKYVHSLGRSILSLSIMIPGGLLVFFASYPIMQKCQEQWQEDGTWALISQKKPIFVEPRSKQAFNSVMNDYYNRINDPVFKGAIFMGVCRGKVAEGLDFADINGRAVIITGLPYPPLKDPKVILKRRYLDVCNAQNKQYLNGQDWYSLEATRAVNQAMGRVIRHRHDYGAILLLDSRFDSPNVKKNMSKWLRNQIGVANSFGQILPLLRNFFRDAEAILPAPTAKEKVAPTEYRVTSGNRSGAFDFSTSSLVNPESSYNYGSSDNSVKLQKRYQSNPEIGTGYKRRKIALITEKPSLAIKQEDCKEYLAMVKKSLGDDGYKKFCKALNAYRTEGFDSLVQCLDDIYRDNKNLQLLMPGLRTYIKEGDRDKFESFSQKLM